MARDARTTTSLKERLADALIELLATKPYEEISISEISDLADVGRTTYYRHFASKDDLLNFKFHIILGDVMDRPQHPSAEKPSQELFKKAFENHLERIYCNRATFEAIYAAELDYLLFKYMYRATVAVIDSTEIVDDYRSALHAATAFAIVDQWISSGFSQNPAELSDMLTSQLHPPHRHSSREESCAIRD